MPESAIEILSESIWFNKYIIVGSDPIFDKNAYANGLRYINDILDKTGQILSYNSLNEKFNMNLSVMS